MKKLLLLSSLLVAGCVSTPGTGPDAWAIVASAGLSFGIDVAVPPVLDRNPSLEPVLSVVAVAIPTAFGTSDMTPGNVALAIQVLGTRYNLPAEFQATLATVVNKGISAYTKTTGMQVASATDPNVFAILKGIGAGLTQGISDWHTGSTRGALPAAPLPGSNAWHMPQGMPIDATRYESGYFSRNGAKVTYSEMSTR